MMAKNVTSKNETGPVFGEIAATGQGLDLGGYVGEIRPPGDPLLKSLGGGLKHYRSLLRDDQVQTAFQQRRRALTSRPWAVEPASDKAIDKAAADSIRAQLEHIKFNAVVDKMLYGLHYGYAVAECIWGRKDSQIILEAIRVRSASRFRFGRDGGLRLLKASHPSGLPMPNRKFWTFSAGAEDDDDPYGLGLGHWLYWPVFLKRNGIKFWAIALEKFGMPTTRGKHGPEASEADKAKLLEAAAAVGTDSAVVIPAGMDLELIEASRRAGGDFDKFAGFMDASIAKVILSQTMTTDNGASLSQAQVHMDVRQEVVEGDDNLICESLNDGPVAWLSEWNFPRAGRPRVKRIFAEPEDLKTAAERDKTLYEIGYEPDEKRIESTYGPGYRRVQSANQANSPAKSGTAFAEAASITDSFDEFGDLMGEGWQAVMAPAVAPIRALAEQSETFDEFTQGLAGLIKEMHIDGLAEALAQGQFAARIAGEAGIPTSDNG